MLSRRVAEEEEEEAEAASPLPGRRREPPPSPPPPFARPFACLLDDRDECERRPLLVPSDPFA